MTKRASFSISCAFDFLNDPLYTGDSNGEEDVCIVRKSVSDTQLLKNNNEPSDISLVEIDAKQTSNLKSGGGYTNAVITSIPELVEKCNNSACIASDHDGTHDDEVHISETLTQEDGCNVHISHGIEYSELQPCDSEEPTTFVLPDIIEDDSEVEIQILDSVSTENEDVSSRSPTEIANNISNQKPSDADIDSLTSITCVCTIKEETDKNANIKMPSVEFEKNDSVESRVTMRNLPRDSQRYSRRTERIVSDAFQFLKLEDDSFCDMTIEEESNQLIRQFDSADEIPSNTTSKPCNVLQRENASDYESNSLEQLSQDMLLVSPENECVKNVSNPSETVVDKDASSSSEHTSDETEGSHLACESEIRDGVDSGIDIAATCDSENSLEQSGLCLSGNDVEILKKEDSQGSSKSMSEVQMEEGVEKAPVLRRRGKNRGSEKVEDHSDSSSDDDTQGMFKDCHSNRK